MSFPRAPLKRFNENIGCAPAPGSYDLKPGALKGVASFDRSDRFSHVKAAALPPPTPTTRSDFMSPVRRTMSVDGLMEGSGVKKENNGMTVERKQQKLLEKEIRSLVQQRGEQDRRMLALEEDLKKVEAKLLAAVREKTGLSANVTTLDRQLLELKKINEFLKNKVSADTTKKRIILVTTELMEARNSLDAKNKELKLLQINTEGQVKALETDLKAARTTVKSLKDRNKDLEDLLHVTKRQNEELENENARLHGVIRELREEITVLERYLDTANDQIQDLHLKLREKTVENSQSQMEKVKHLETDLEQRTIELETTQIVLGQKEEEANKFKQELQASKEALLEVETRLKNQELELKSSQSSVSDMEEQMHSADQEVQESHATVFQQEAELARLRGVLRRTEKELDERVAHLEQRCLFSEEDRSKTQEEGMRRVEELKAERIVLKEARKEDQNRQTALQQEHAALTEELTKEKDLVDSLTVLVEQEREESEERLRQLKDEMEEVLGELTLLEEQELRRQETTESRQEEIQRLQEGNDELEKQLSDTRALFESKSNEGAAFKEEHLAAITDLQEAHTNALSKMADIVTELESARDALRGAGGRREELEAEVERLTQQVEEMEKGLQQKEEEVSRLKEGLEERQLAEAKAMEDNSRKLLEVQTCLAQKDEEIKAMETSHVALITQLQQDIQLQTKAREEALGQLEAQRGQGLTQLQKEKEKAQTLVEEVRQEKGEIMEQLTQEREEKFEIQIALQVGKEALEVEREEHQQVRSEVLRRNAEIERIDEEMKSLLSQVEVKEQSRLALENELNVAEQERNRLEEVVQGGVNFQEQLDIMEEKTLTLQRELEEQRQDRRALQEQVEVLTQEKVTLQWEMEEQRQELKRQITEAQEKSSENEKWRKQYEELFAKVRPFQEQLNAFAAERNTLLNENGANQEELNKLSDAYVRLLGHQNQKQKIKHVMKLKDENIALKQEVAKLQSQVNRQKCDLEQLNSNPPATPRRKFDPSKAFKHDKENMKTETLKGNLYA
ncbi:hyaluronan mediated motility receptor isoform X1 [Pseudochaenichthys georgianus]|uniref:hyaluronan mediated motility receptor isoform X1 n=1 Tax=Pseudochaenichthys georgianus TaxID=52239 RepID=UPI00146AA18D|nr:hyaluronan mediated motility receptor isoform X1 [Pseudochaenichthys georgianus]